ncbi:MAG: hypothetical protein JJ979_07150, partial [Roseibium sp.]|nr:hypothetical protein [Roseibium sp.]
MAVSLARSNIVIFFISMSLVLLLALGVYASKGLLTHWLLVRGLEQEFVPQEATLKTALITAAEEASSSVVVPGLRLSTQPASPEEKASSDLLRSLQDSLKFDNDNASILDAALVFPGGQSATATAITG